MCTYLGLGPLASRALCQCTARTPPGPGLTIPYPIDVDVDSEVDIRCSVTEQVYLLFFDMDSQSTSPRGAVLIWIHRSSHHRELIFVSVSLLSTTTTVTTRGAKTKPKILLIPQSYAIYLETVTVLPCQASPKSHESCCTSRRTDRVTSNA